jgi:predicted RecA/RadA family phage recombinase
MNVRKAFTFTQPEKTAKSGHIVFFGQMFCLPLNTRESKAHAIQI